MEEEIVFTNIVNVRNVASVSRKKFITLHPSQELSVYELTQLLENQYLVKLNCKILSNDASMLNSKFIETLENNFRIVSIPHLEKKGLFNKYFSRNVKILGIARKRFLKDRVFTLYALLKLRMSICKDVSLLIVKKYFEMESRDLYPEIVVSDILHLQR